MGKAPAQVLSGASIANAIAFQALVEFLEDRRVLPRGEMRGRLLALLKDLPEEAEEAQQALNLIAMSLRRPA